MLLPRFATSPVSLTRESPSTVILFVFARKFALLDAQEPASGSRRPAVDFDSRPSHRLQKLRRGGLFSQRQAQRPQPLVQRINRVVGDACNPAFPQIKHSQRLERVVQLGSGEISCLITRIYLSGLYELTLLPGVCRDNGVPGNYRPKPFDMDTVGRRPITFHMYRLRRVPVTGRHRN